MGPSVRRGRLPASERAARRTAVLDAALAELIDKGWEATTMQAVARRASASKETLYAWFDSKEGLLDALREHHRAATVERLASGLSSEAALEDPEGALSRFAAGLLRTLTGPESLAFNRAAMSSPPVAQLLLDQGRRAVGPVVEDFLARLDRAGRLRVPDPADAFTVLFGLTVRDTQIRVLLGDEPPGEEAVARRAEAAARSFCLLYGGAGHSSTGR